MHLFIKSFHVLVIIMMQHHANAWWWSLEKWMKHWVYVFICIFNQLFILEYVIYGEMERMFTTQEKGASLAARIMDFGSLWQTGIQCMLVNCIVGHKFRGEIYIIYTIVFSTFITIVYFNWYQRHAQVVWMCELHRVISWKF